MHQSSRSKATTDDVQVHSSEATTDIVNLATDLVTAYTGGFDCDFLRRGFWCCTIVMEMVMVVMVEKVTMASVDMSSVILTNRNRNTNTNTPTRRRHQ